jgi:alpha-tubulin suppressor-like RCC1 family protein
MFQIELSLTIAQMDTVFGDGQSPVYIEVSSGDKVYPRQKFSYAPLALRVPVDGQTIQYRNGQLTLGRSGLGPVELGANATLGLGRFTSGQESSMVLGLGQGDVGKSWYNKDTKEIKFFDGEKSVSVYSSNGRDLRLNDAAGVNSLGLKSPAVLTNSVTWTLPPTDGASGDVLSTNGSGQLAWTAVAGSGGGTVTNVSLNPPPAGIAVTGSPVTSSGSFSLALTNDLAAVESISTTGVVERTGPESWGTFNVTPAGKFFLSGVDAATQRTILGLGPLATMSSVSGGFMGSIASGSITNNEISNMAGIAQSKISNLTTDLAGKEPVIAAGTTSQYLRGDKTWQVLDTSAVPESTNLYFTPSRVRQSINVTSPLALDQSTGQLSITMASESTPGYLSASDFSSFNSKQSLISSSSIINVGTLTTSRQSGVEVKPYGNVAGNTGELRFDELSINGGNFVGFKAADSLTANKIWSLPAGDGSAGQVLTTNGAGVLSWATVSGGGGGGGGTVTSVDISSSSDGLSISGGPIINSGTINMSLANDLAAVEGLTGTGGVERTAEDTWSTYPITSSGKALLAGENAATQRMTLGLGFLATLNTVSGGASGTIADGTITNDDIAASAGIVDSKLATISSEGKVANTATTATSSSSQNTIVARDNSGNFSAGVITATLNGNASNVSGTVAIANGGTGATNASSAFEALSPLVSQGDLLMAGGNGNDARLPGNTSTTRQFLMSQGTGSSANNPTWTTMTATDLPAHSANLITSGTLEVAQGGTGVATTTANTVFAGPAATSGAPSFRALAPADLPTMVGATSGTAGTAGAVPAPASGSQDAFLSAAGNWQKPRHFGQQCPTGQYVTGFTAVGEIMCSRLSVKFSKIYRGVFFTCGLMVDQTVRCWGRNVDGANGDNSTTNNLIPTPVRTSTLANLSGVTSLSVGAYHACAVSGGSVYCWGLNAWGNLGHNSNVSKATAYLVTGITNATAVGAGGYHSCALLDDRTVKCWGHNTQGQLGDGTLTERWTPVSVSGLANVTAISVGSRYTCALLTDSTVRCWGYNGYGQLGDNSTTNRTTPVAVSGLNSVAKIATSVDHYNWHDTAGSTCAVKTDGTVWCWGHNGQGQLGDNTLTDRLLPVQVLRDDNNDGTCTEGALNNVTEITSGARSACAILSDSSLRCWGHNANYKLGEGGTTNKKCAVPVLGIGGAGTLTNVSHVHVGGDFWDCPAVVLSSGDGVQWGYNNNGQLGDNSVTNRQFLQYVQLP